jgi:hypothetical protein
MIQYLIVMHSLEKRFRSLEKVFKVLKLQEFSYYWQFFDLEDFCFFANFIHYEQLFTNLPQFKTRLITCSSEIDDFQTVIHETKTVIDKISHIFSFLIFILIF